MAAESSEIEDHVHVADVYAFRGMKDEAFALLLETHNALERNKDQRPFAPVYLQEEMRTSPFLKPLHDDPRWSVLNPSSD